MKRFCNTAKKPILYIPSFRQGDIQHGGTLRSNQIREHLRGSNAVDEVNLDCRFTVLNVLSGLLLNGLRLLPLLFDLKLTLKGFLVLCRLSGLVKPCCLANRTIVLEVCGDIQILLGHLIVSPAHTVHLLPHNIESMVHSAHSKLFYNRTDWLDAELKLYRKCKKVSVISDYDAAVLRCFNISCSVYPYYPAQQRLNQLLTLQKKRRDSASNQNQIILIASVINPPTSIAVESFIKTHYTSDSCCLPLVIAGFGTERFKKYESSALSVLGSIEADKLEQLLASAMLAIIPVNQTTGFLTKLVENNLIGLKTLVYGHYIQASQMESYGIYLHEDETQAFPTQISYAMEPLRLFVCPENPFQ